MTTVASMSPCRDVPQPVNVPSRQPTRAGSAAFGGSTFGAGSGVGAVAGVGAAGVTGGVGALVTTFAAAVVDDVVVLADAPADDVTEVAPSGALLPFAAEGDDATFAATVAAGDDVAAVVALGFAAFDALSLRVATWATAADVVDAFVPATLVCAAAESAAAIVDALPESVEATTSLCFGPSSLDVAAARLTPFSSGGGRRRPSSSDANRSAASRVRRLPAE